MERGNLIKRCELCDKNATCICFKCNNYYCDNCFKLIHDFPNYSIHKKEIIDPFLPFDIKCPIHPEDRMNLFCIDEKGKLKIIFFF